MTFPRPRACWCCCQHWERAVSVQELECQGPLCQGLVRPGRQRAFAMAPATAAPALALWLSCHHLAEHSRQEFRSQSAFWFIHTKVPRPGPGAIDSIMLYSVLQARELETPGLRHPLSPSHQRLPFLCPAKAPHPDTAPADPTRSHPGCLHDGFRSLNSRL